MDSIPVTIDYSGLDALAAMTPAQLLLRSAVLIVKDLDEDGFHISFCIPEELEPDEPNKKRLGFGDPKNR